MRKDKVRYTVYMRRKKRVYDAQKISIWKYKNLTLSFFGILLAYIVFQNEPIHAFFSHLGTLGYVGAFFAGILFVSTFTVATGALILFILAESLHPLEIGVIAGLGAVCGDMIIFRYVKNNLLDELKSIYKIVDRNKRIKKLTNTPYFSWMLPVLGVIIIASPLPDELGVSLLGIAKMRTIPFMLVSFLLNSIGIFLVVSASLLI